MEQLYNYIKINLRLGSFEDGYINHCRVYGDFLLIDDDWYWYMSAYYPDSIDIYLYMKSGCLFLETGIEILEWDEVLGMYTQIPIESVDDYNGTDI